MEQLVYKKLITGLEAKAKARPRGRVVMSREGHNRLRGLPQRFKPWVQIYMPSDYTEYIEKVQKLLGKLEVGKAYAIRIYVTRQMPVSWSKKKQAERLGTLVLSTPDRDNLAGAIMDAIAPLEWEHYTDESGKKRKKRKPGTGDEMVAVLRDIEVRWWYEHTIYVDAYEVDPDEQVFYPWLKRPGDEKGLF